MNFLPTKFEGVWNVEQQRHVDVRGFFARSWCRTEFIDHGLNPDLVQCNVSFNSRKGTVRGMHF
ncbi:MAG: dTDP-4-dehydrorhamnose 3,5-epimerase family protein, partial [Planctomycetaceae bacterium]